MSLNQIINRPKTRTAKAVNKALVFAELSQKEKAEFFGSAAAVFAGNIQVGWSVVGREAGQSGCVGSEFRRQIFKSRAPHYENRALRRKLVGHFGNHHAAVAILVFQIAAD